LYTRPIAFGLLVLLIAQILVVAGVPVVVGAEEPFVRPSTPSFVLSLSDAFSAALRHFIVLYMGPFTGLLTKGFLHYTQNFLQGGAKSVVTAGGNMHPLISKTDALTGSVGIGSWLTTENYPFAVTGESCAASSSYVYCVGGQTSSSGTLTNSVYYAPLTASGVGVWTQTTSYPIPIVASSCVIASGYIYCVGGYSTSLLSNATAGPVYYAPISPSGVGNWTATTSYPIAISAESCVQGSGEIYCIGGTNDNSASATSAVYYASLSSAGIGAWTTTTSYPVPISDESCVIWTGELYCIGGDTNFATTNLVYYASTTGSGLGVWSSATQYPISAQDESCIVSSADIFCVGGFNVGTQSTSDSVNSAAVSPSVGSWNSATSYPLSDAGLSCVTNSGDIYCVGGLLNPNQETSAVYYAAIQSTVTSTTTLVSCSSSSMTVGSATLCTATVSGNSPTGTVSWSQTAGTGSVSFSESTCTLSSGSCSVTVKATSTGSATVSAFYGGDSNNAGSSGQITLSVTQATPSLSVICNPSSFTVGGSTSCSATLTGGYFPTGTVTFTASGSTGSFNPSNGECTLSQASCAVSYTDNSAGTITITAEYSGDTNTQPNSGQTTVTVYAQQKTVELLTPCINQNTVDINGVASPGSLVSSISWSWGDGQVTTGFFPQIHDYSSSGRFTVTVTAEFNDGSTASASVNVSVGAPGELTGCDAVVINSGYLVSQTGEGGSVTYSSVAGSGSVAPGTSAVVFLAQGDPLFLSETPLFGFNFNNWSLSPDIVSSDALNSPSLNVVVNGYGCVSANFLPENEFQITTTCLPTGAYGDSYSYALQATGGPPRYSWQLMSGSSLISGLSLSSSGVISGTPENWGSDSFIVQVTDSNGLHAWFYFTMIVTQGVQLKWSSLPVAHLGEQYSFDFSASGGKPPYSFFDASPCCVPPGLSLSSSGTLSGTPTQAGEYTFSVGVKDSAGGWTTQTYILMVPPFITGLSEDSGAESGGETVVITGLGFSGATSVNFGSQLATFTIVSNTEIKAVVPAASQPGTVNVVVGVGAYTSGVSVNCGDVVPGAPSCNQFVYLPPLSASTPICGSANFGYTFPSVSATPQGLPTGVSVQLSGSAAFSANTQVCLDVSGFSIEQATFTETLNPSVTAQLSATLTKGYTNTFQIGDPIEFDPFYIQAGPVPIVVIPIVTPVLTVSASATSSTTISFISSPQLTLNLQWTAGSGFELTHSFACENNGGNTAFLCFVIQSSTVVSGSARASIGFEVTLSFYDLGGPTMTPEAYLQFNGGDSTTTSTPAYNCNGVKEGMLPGAWWAICGGLGLKIGGQLGPAGYSSASVAKTFALTQQLLAASVQVSPATVTLGLGQSQQFKAIVAGTNEYPGSLVQWSLQQATGCGTLSSSSGVETKFVAPSSLAGQCTNQVIAHLSSALTGLQSSAAVTVDTSALPNTSALTVANDHLKNLVFEPVPSGHQRPTGSKRS